jgi:predicted helicase
MVKSIHDILREFRNEATSNRDLGDRFERLICRYLQLDPLYADRFSHVWMWNEWPLKGKVGDVGIDLVAQERATGEYCAIQCKFFLPDHTIAKEDIDSFFTAAGKTQFSSCMIVSTTDRWSKNAEHALQNQSKPVFRLRVQDLDASPVDWSKFSLQRPQDIGLRERKSLMEHQKVALRDVMEGLKKADRGKLIMACGTGKTFTSLKIAEQMAPHGNVLFLVPSISLLSQSLREWTAETSLPLHPLAVCSDTKVGKRKSKDDEDGTDILTYDLAFPATTSTKEIIRQYHALKEKGKGSSHGMTVVFSTYQSIVAVAGAQKAGFPEFDLIVCDEAHRTTGVTLSGEDESHFVKVHDNDFIKGRKRLYMTATPRIYGDESKVKAREASAELCSMDDQDLFGEELHRLGFGEAVGRGLLADYKVLVLAVGEKYVSKTFQRLIADQGSELRLDDAVKIMGCWNGLAKRVGQSTDEASNFHGDLAPMRRAVAFSRSIKDSRAFVDKFSRLIEEYRTQHPDADGRLACELEHVDGTFDSLRRGELLDWLKASHQSSACRILSNARCLSEGVDVPALDAVLFLNPRNSMVDVVQSVGRVMRRAEGKKYGYIILPIGIPADVPPEEALKDNDKYKVVWQVLQALRAHDDRFNAQVNHIELNKKRPESIQVIGVGGDYPEKKPGGIFSVHEQRLFDFPQLEEWKDAIYARVVLKCGDRRYWENWAKDVAQIAERHSTRIKALLGDGDARHTRAFAAFLEGLRKNINPSISEGDAIEMLSQHLITRPVFDALFEGYAFTQHNPVSKAMQRMVNALEDQSLEKETTALEKFYASVRTRVAGVSDPEGKQKVVVELYDKFFRAAFPKMAERLGIVYTPVELVDFILHSVNDALKDEFGSTLSDKDVHIIDPFTGTGTFIVRLLQSGLIRPEDMERKYLTELHANEIVLLAYYIAAINIEEAFHGLTQNILLSGNGKKTQSSRVAYVPFEGIVLTDTFQLSESRGNLEEKLFPENNQRLKRQKQSPIRVVVGNPPYSVGQTSENDGNKNLKYPMLDDRIRTTYASESSAVLKTSLYDSYVRAVRWASDRIADKGIIGFVTNGSFIDGNAMDGLRACLAKEFSGIYVFNLRGNQRTSGEISRMEGGKIFGSGSRAGIAISLFVKNPKKNGKCDIHYYDIGDYLDREQKLAVIRDFQSIAGIHKQGKWKKIKPNASHDWINQRDPEFDRFTVIGEKEPGSRVKKIFETYSHGVKTNRDAWCYNFSRKNVGKNIERLISNYNQQVPGFAKVGAGKSQEALLRIVEDYVDKDPQKISWSRALKSDLIKGVKHSFDPKAIQVGVYRPFNKQAVYHDKHLNELLGLMPSIFPDDSLENLVIVVSGAGASKGFSSLISNCIPNFHMHDSCQCFPLYIYDRDEKEAGELISRAQDGELIGGYRRRFSITDITLSDFRTAYGSNVSQEDIFYYVYGILHSSEYRERFASDLKKMLPRIPMTKEAADFRRFCQAGRDLAKLHVNYETVEPYPLKEESSELALDPKRHFLVSKMTFSRKGKEIDKTRVIYNNHLSLSGIPLEAYEYVVNGKSAIEWIMERYQVTTDQDSGIHNDPNDWAKETKQPRYIVDLLKRIVRVSLESMKIVGSLPALND